VCVCVCVSVCPHSERKITWAVNTKLGRHRPQCTAVARHAS